MNAVFVRSVSLNREFYDQARQQGCRVYVEFPTLNGINYLQDNPEAWPINEKGEQFVKNYDIYSFELQIYKTLCFAC